MGLFSWATVQALAEAEGGLSLLRYLGVAWAARLVLNLMGRRPVVRSRGFEFFPTRDELDRNRNYDALFESAEKIDAVYTTGRKLIDRDIRNIRRLNRVILPDPRSESLVSYAKSLDRSPDTERNIEKVTKHLLETHKIEVRWYPHMICSSFKVGNADRNDGWVHVEITPPFSEQNLRPSFFTRRVRHEDTVRVFSNVFERMWSASTEPDKGLIEGKGMDIPAASARDVETTDDSADTSIIDITLRVSLSDLRKVGVEIRNEGRKPPDEDTANAWIEKVKDWKQKTINAVSKIDEADARWYEILNEVPKKPTIPIGKVFGDDHLKYYREHHERLRRLEILIQKYSKS